MFKFQKYYVPGMISLMGIMIIGSILCGTFGLKRMTCLNIKYTPGDIETNSISCGLSPRGSFHLNEYRIFFVNLSTNIMNAQKMVEDSCNLALQNRDSLFAVCVNFSSSDYVQLINLWDYCLQIDHTLIQTLGDTLWIFPVTKVPAKELWRWSSFQINPPEPTSRKTRKENEYLSIDCIPSLDKKMGVEAQYGRLDNQFYILFLLWLGLVYSNVLFQKRL